MVKNKEYKDRKKHIDTKFHFTNDLVNKRVIDIKYCPTEKMVADIMTKPLGSTKLKNIEKDVNWWKK